MIRVKTSDFAYKASVDSAKPGCVWSGVYYVEVGDLPTTEHPKSGVIEFLDPRSGAEMVALPGTPFAQQRTILPKSGEMIVFPSWLKHLVHPYWGEANESL
jgi:uncharacterized protein (TIGR02466 family)